MVGEEGKVGAETDPLTCCPSHGSISSCSNESFLATIIFVKYYIGSFVGTLGGKSAVYLNIHI